MTNNLILSLKAAGPIYQRKLKSELRAEKGLPPFPDGLFIEELMESFQDSENLYFEREDVKRIMSFGVNNHYHDIVEQDRFIQQLKEMSDEDHIDICFECKVI